MCYDDSDCDENPKYCLNGCGMLIEDDPMLNDFCGDECWSEYRMGKAIENERRIGGLPLFGIGVEP